MMGAEGRGEFGRVMGCLGGNCVSGPGRAGCPGTGYGRLGRGIGGGGRKGEQEAVKRAELSTGFDESAMWSYQADGFAYQADGFA
jgi:hypothetical protein